jgi:hypothetical protein
MVMLLAGSSRDVDEHESLALTQQMLRSVNPGARGQLKQRVGSERGT